MQSDIDSVHSADIGSLFFSRLPCGWQVRTLEHCLALTVHVCMRGAVPASQVLPHLLEEVRSEQLQQLVLPLVIHILGKQDKQVMSNLV